MSEPSFWTRQPGFAIYTIYTIGASLIKLPLLAVLHAFPAFRTVPTWTFRQSIMRALSRIIMEYTSAVEFELNAEPFNLEPGKEKERFVIIPPADDLVSTYQGPALSATNPVGIKPTTIGGTWYPSAPPSNHHLYEHESGKRIFLHFHGGAYVLFSARDAHNAWGANMLLKHSPKGKAAVFVPQYRLSSIEGGRYRFPAALQDAITAYSHLVVRLRIPPRDIVISGDSAGGNLALALLRYLCSEFNSSLPRPTGGVMLWSPWTDLSISAQENTARPEHEIDIVNARVIEWGKRMFLPDNVNDGDDSSGERRACDNPYISPSKKGIETDAPVWVMLGGKELLVKDILRFVELQREESRKAGGKVALYVIRDGTHDMYMAAEGLGWVEETDRAVEHAMRFFDGRF